MCVSSSLISKCLGSLNCHQSCADDPLGRVKRCPKDNLDMDWFCVRPPFSTEFDVTSNL
jgi:hypothetical protein